MRIRFSLDIVPESSLRDKERDDEAKRGKIIDMCIAVLKALVPHVIGGMMPQGIGMPVSSDFDNVLHMRDRTPDAPNDDGLDPIG